MFSLTRRMVILESIRHVYKKDDIPLVFFKLLFASSTLANLHSLHYTSFFLYKFTTLCTGHDFGTLPKRLAGGTVAWPPVCTICQSNSQTKQTNLHSKDILKDAIQACWCVHIERWTKTNRKEFFQLFRITSNHSKKQQLCSAAPDTQQFPLFS